MTRPPLSYKVVVAALLWSVQNKVAHVGLMLFETYLRVGEILSMRVEDVVSSRLQKHDKESRDGRGVFPGSPPGEQHLNMVLDLPLQQHLGSARETKATESVLVGLLVRLAIEGTGANTLGPSLHCLRHGEAIHDRLINEISHTVRQQRGSWKAVSCFVTKRTVQ